MDFIVEALIELFVGLLRLLGRLVWFFLEQLLWIPDLILFTLELLTSSQDKKQQIRGKRQARRARLQERKQTKR